MSNRPKDLRAHPRLVAAAPEVSRQSVNAIETGRYDPSHPLALKITDLFDLAIDDVFTSPSMEK